MTHSKEWSLVCVYALATVVADYFAWQKFCGLATLNVIAIHKYFAKGNFR